MRTQRQQARIMQQPTDSDQRSGKMEKFAMHSAGPAPLIGEGSKK